MTVPARPQSIVVEPSSSSAGMTRRSSPNPPVAGIRSNRVPESLQALDHQLAVAGPQRGAQRRRTVGEGGEHELAIRQRLRAGERHDRLERGRRDGRPPSVIGLGLPGLAVRIELGGGIPRNLHRLSTVASERWKEMVRVSSAVLERPVVPMADDLGWPVMTADETESTPTTAAPDDEGRSLGDSSRSRRCRSSTSSTRPRCA